MHIALFLFYSNQAAKAGSFYLSIMYCLTITLPQLAAGLKQIQMKIQIKWYHPLLK